MFQRQSLFLFHIFYEGIVETYDYFISLFVIIRIFEPKPGVFTRFSLRNYLIFILSSLALKDHIFYRILTTSELAYTDGDAFVFQIWFF